MVLEKIKNAATSRERWHIKNMEFEKLEFPVLYAVKDIDIEVLSAKENPTGQLEIQLNARKDGKILDVNAPFVYQNPPIIHNGEVDILGTMKEIIADTLKMQLK